MTALLALMQVARTRLGSKVPVTMAPLNSGPKKGTWRGEEGRRKR